MTHKPFVDHITHDGWRAIHASMVNTALLTVVAYVTLVFLDGNAGAAVIIMALVMSASFWMHKQWHDRLDLELEEQP